MRVLIAALLLPAALLPAGGRAQDVSGLLSQLGGAKAGGGALGALGGAGGGLGGLLGGAGASNITGLLGYCLKNQLLGAAPAPAADSGGAAGLLGKLAGKPGVAQSQGFLAGRAGVVQAGGSSLPLGSLGDGVKQQVCKTVLGRAKGLLGR